MITASLGVNILRRYAWENDTALGCLAKRDIQAHEPCYTFAKRLLVHLPRHAFPIYSTEHAHASNNNAKPAQFTTSVVRDVGSSSDLSTSLTCRYTLALDSFMPLIRCATSRMCLKWTRRFDPRAFAAAGGAT